MTQITQMPPKRRKGKLLLISLAAALCIAGILIGVWFATADSRAYKDGIALMNAGDHTGAAAIFESLADYKDAPLQHSKARYAIGNDLLESKDYDAAITVFKSLGDFQDAPQRIVEANYAIAIGFMKDEAYLSAAEMFAQTGNYGQSKELMGKCYYTLATGARLSKDYQQACTYFDLAGDYSDASTQKMRTIYTMRHEAFLSGDYEAAQKYLEQLGGDETKYGDPHFMTVDDAADFLASHLDSLSRQIRFCVAEKPDKRFYEALRNYLPYHNASVAYYDPDHLINITAAEYYPGDIILDAWENGTTDALTADEKAVLELAQQLIAQAKQETDSDLGMEIWLHNWLCRQITYESPDMDVKFNDYLALRQLNCIGAMLDGKANCQGYTDAFYLLGNLAGFEVRRLFGVAGEGHVWNLIRLDGQWYIVDVTFDDVDRGHQSGWVYTYFNAPWDPEVYDIFGGPEVIPELATEYSADYSYFTYANKYFETVYAAANSLVDQLLEEGPGWRHVVLDDTSVSWDEFNDQIRSSLLRKGVRLVQWSEYLDEYDGKLYMTVFWIHK